MTTPLTTGGALAGHDTRTPEALMSELEEPKSRARFSLGRLDFASPIAVYVGLGLIVLGFVLLIVTWAQTAGLLEVARQLPYVVSGGFSALAFVMIGLLLVNVSVRRQDAAERARETGRIVEALQALNDRLDDLGREE